MAIMLEVFNAHTPVRKNYTIVLDKDSLDKMKLEAHENGYKNGWDDGQKHVIAEHHKVAENIEYALRTLLGECQNAKTDVISALKPAILQIFEALLPCLSKQALALNLSEVLLPLMEKSTSPHIEIFFNPNDRESVETAIALHKESFPIVLKEHVDLKEGRILTKTQEYENIIDMDDTIKTILHTLDTHFDIQ